MENNYKKWFRLVDDWKERLKEEEGRMFVKAVDQDATFLKEDEYKSRIPDEILIPSLVDIKIAGSDSPALRNSRRANTEYGKAMNRKIMSDINFNKKIIDISKDDISWTDEPVRPNRRNKIKRHVS